MPDPRPPSRPPNAANQASASAGATGVIGTGAAADGHRRGGAALRGAEKYLGVPYQWGGASTSGLDCSGLTMLAWHAAGVDLLHSAAIQYDESAHIPLSQVQPGDLLFYDLEGDGIDHVVMYVGSGPYGAEHHHPGRPHRDRGRVRPGLVSGAGGSRPALTAPAEQPAGPRLPAGPAARRRVP